MQTTNSQEKLFFLWGTQCLLVCFGCFSHLIHISCYQRWPSTHCAAGVLYSRPECGIPFWYECSLWICRHVNFVKFGSLCEVCHYLYGIGQHIWFMSAFVRLSQRLSWLNYSPLFIHVVRYDANSCTVSKIFLLPSTLTWRYQTLRGYMAPYESSFEGYVN